MEFKNIKLDVSGNIAKLTICRPRQLNAVNREMLDELSSGLDLINKMDDIRCMIVTGEGERAFVAGADTTAMEPMDSFQAAALSQKGNEVFLMLQRMPMPSIAAVNGFALGGGLEMALSCDIRIASEKAVFGLPEVTLGIMPGWGGTQRLTRLIGYSKACELIFTGRRVDAKEALQSGIVSEVYPLDKLMDRAYELAELISSNAPVGIRNAKKAMNLGLQQDLKSAVETEALFFGNLFSTEDKETGLSAFNSRQSKPQFKNK